MRRVLLLTMLVTCMSANATVASDIGTLFGAGLQFEGFTVNGAPLQNYGNPSQLLGVSLSNLSVEQNTTQLGNATAGVSYTFGYGNPLTFQNLVIQTDVKAQASDGGYAQAQLHLAGDIVFTNLSGYTFDSVHWSISSNSSAFGFPLVTADDITKEYGAAYGALDVPGAMGANGASGITYPTGGCATTDPASAQVRIVGSSFVCGDASVDNGTGSGGYLTITNLKPGESFILSFDSNSSAIANANVPLPSSILLLASAILSVASWRRVKK